MAEKRTTILDGYTVEFLAVARAVDQAQKEEVPGSQFAFSSAARGCIRPRQPQRAIGNMDKNWGELDIPHDQLQWRSRPLQRTGDRIAAAQQTVLETEAVAMGIQAELSRNRETLAATQAKVHEVGALARRSDDIVTRMSSWVPWRKGS
ncbi:hypothetical protein ACHHYP_06985 [Achlya hypogyna]|uniref:Uncharacterized protein n=1 Tax=Achlya hypogyna TaxID=1202772 RepID=A0A1V9YRV4_ACHHY|nr:hypothetical protein ACHHYP_06985 [Achlya hypogyna]